MQYEMAEKLFYNSKKILISVLWKLSQTRSSDDFPHCRCCGWHHAPLVQAEFPNVYYVESINVFFWGDSIAYGSLVDVLWQREIHSKYEFTIANLIQIHSASCGFIIAKEIENYSTFNIRFSLFHYSKDPSNERPNFYTQFTFYISSFTFLIQ